MGTLKLETLVINALRAKGAPMTIPDLCAVIDADRNTLGVRLTYMAQEGLLRRVERGVYDLAENTQLSDEALDEFLHSTLIAMRRSTPPNWGGSLAYLMQLACQRFEVVSRKSMVQALDRLAAAGKVRAARATEGELIFELPMEWDPPGWPLPGATHVQGAVIDWRPRPPPHLTKEEAEAVLKQYAPPYPTAGHLDRLLWPAPPIPAWARHCVATPATLAALMS